MQAQTTYSAEDPKKQKTYVTTGVCPVVYLFYYRACPVAYLFYYGAERTPRQPTLFRAMDARAALIRSDARRVSAVCSQ